MLVYKNGEYVEVNSEELLEEITPETPQSTDEKLDELKESVAEIKSLLLSFFSK